MERQAPPITRLDAVTPSPRSRRARIGDPLPTVGVRLSAVRAPSISITSWASPTVTTSAPDVTVVVVPRERFDQSLRSLDSILEHTDGPYRMVYVDGRSPRRIRDELRRRAIEGDFTLVRSDRYLSPNQARNLGMRHVDTPFVVFVDNDLIVTPGWLARLMTRARSTGAWIVGPLYYEGDPAQRIIHVAGGDLEIDGEPGARRLATTHRHQGMPVTDVAPPLQSEPCGFVEFHCMLVRSEVFRLLGPLDEDLLSTREHLDLCLQVHDAGGEVWFEPASEVTYSTPPPVSLRDVPYFWLRWSETWNRASLAHFCTKHGITPGYQKRLGIMRRRRQVVFDPVRRLARATLGRHGERWVGKVLSAAEPRLNRLLVRQPARARVAHRE